jgi:hypothetical protein
MPLSHLLATQSVSNLAKEDISCKHKQQTTQTEE